MVVNEEDDLWFRAMLEYARICAQNSGVQLGTLSNDKAKNVADVAAVFADQAVLQWRNYRLRLARL